MSLHNYAEPARFCRNLIKKKMSGIRKCLWDMEKNFLIFLKRAGFFLRFFAYVEAGYRKLGYQLLRKKPAGS
jgi:hypothetical protein